jgi:hypothetical protein
MLAIWSTTIFLWHPDPHICVQNYSVVDPWHFGPDPAPDPAIFLIDPQDANKILFFCLLLFDGTHIYIIIFQR